MTSDITDDLALRLGLASKAIPVFSLKEFISLLAYQLEHPVTQKKLRALTPKKLYQILSSHNEDVERGQSNQAHAILTSDTISDMTAPVVLNQLPIKSPKLKVAVTSNNAEMIDGHFGSCLRILIYEVNKETWQLSDVRAVNTLENGLARTDYLVSLITDCQLLATLSIGGPAAAKVTRADIHPIKQAYPSPSSDVLTRVQEMLNASPPPWIKKMIARQGEDNE